MMVQRYMLGASEIRSNVNVGNKAASLALLKQRGFLIPETYVCQFDAFNQYREGVNIQEDLKEQLTEIINAEKRYSIRSSADIEDTSSYSFAGQFKTHLDVKGIDNIVSSVQDIWESSDELLAKSYLNTLAKESKKPRMAVIIQEMVDSILSGVVFTRNPITGLDEVIVELVEGRGSALVQDGVTPERWVKKWGNWIELPKENEDHKYVVEDVIAQAERITKEFRIPVDLEWVYDGQNIYWLQMREITTIRNIDLYSNKISREFLPGIIKPLVYSVNIPVVNSSWKALFEELIGRQAKNIRIERLTKSFYYRAYFNMGVIGEIFQLLGMPREALEILAGIETPEEGRPSFRPGPRTIIYLPRILKVALKKLFFGHDIERFIKRSKSNYHDAAKAYLMHPTIEECFEYIERLFELNIEASYFVILSQLLNSLYNMLLASRCRALGIDPEKVAFNEVAQRLQPIDPRHHLSELHAIRSKIPRNVRDRIPNLTWDEMSEEASLKEFSVKLGDFYRRFGHLSDSGNDFSRPTWRENPRLVISMIEGYSPKGAREGVEDFEKSLEKNLKENGFLRAIYRRAIKFREYRESVNFIYTFGYGLFRKFFLRLADLWMEENIFTQRDDIFYLDYKELLQLRENRNLAGNMRTRISRRKDEIERFKDVVLPEVIYGELPESALISSVSLTTLKGVATSKGHYIGPARVVTGLQDFSKIQEGDVLIIPFSDVSWTPLFAKAKAVVSESGGILSHCSIVAREYGIPAVVSVQGALKIEDNTPIAVDGFQGIVRVLQERLNYA